MLAAIYSRKSKFSEKGESVENQIKLCEEYGNYLGIKEFKIYEDEGFSGGNVERPQFQKMLRDAKNKKFDMLICYRLDRISRNVLDFSQTIEELKKNNIEFISIKEQFDTSTPMGRAMMNIAAVFAQLERETIAERIKDNMLELAKTGRWLGGTAPLGYKSEPMEYSDSNGKAKKMYKLVQVPEEIELVKLIFTLYLDNKKYSSVATHLCKNHYKGKNGGEFSKGTVEQIIGNPVYCIADEHILNYFKKQGSTMCGELNGINGLMTYNKREGGKKDNPVSEWIISVGKHKGIVSSDIWLKCVEINNQNKQKASPRSGTGNKFLLSGLIVCGCCGSGMASWSHLNKKTDLTERYYRCNLKNRAATRCSTKMLNAYKAEDYVISHLKSIDEETFIKNYKAISKDIELKNNIGTEIASLKKHIEENNSIIKGYMRKLAVEEDADIISMMKEDIKALKEDNLTTQYKINKLEATDLTIIISSHEQLEDIIDRLRNFKKFIDFCEDVESKRKLILSVVENIIWHSESEILEVNLIGSGKKLTRGAVQSRNLCFGNSSRWDYYQNTNINTNPLLINFKKNPSK